MKTVAALLVACSVFALRGAGSAWAQSLPTATGPGTYVALGGGVSAFNTDYGHNQIGGGVVFLDLNPEWRAGLEAEARFLRWHPKEQVIESSYLVGVRVPVWSRPARFSPYVKFLAGAGEITLPYGYAHGGFLAYAPGAGVDLAVNDRLSVRVVDLEYQKWPEFTYGALSPYGLSVGLSFRLNGISRYPEGVRAFRH